MPLVGDRLELKTDGTVSGIVPKALIFLPIYVEFVSLEIFQGVCQQLQIAMMLGYKGGLRLGEVFGLSWEDVSFENSTIKVQRQVQWDEVKKVWYFSNPKYDSCRTIDLDKDCMGLLEREKELQRKSKEYYEEHYTTLYENESRQLNTNSKGKPINLINIRDNGEFIIPRTMQHTSAIIHYQMNYMDFTFHSLRHTHATLLAESDAPPKYLQKRMGHSNLEVTMKFYLHLTDKMQEKGSDILKNVFQTKEEAED